MRDWFAYVRENLGDLQVSPARATEIVAELAQQLEQACNAAVARGASPQQAEAAAIAQFPDWQALRREIQSAEPNRLRREDRKPSIFSGTLQDFRHAARLLRANLAFALLAICTLAFGIGANSAIFTIVDALALKPLPYQDPSRLVAIESRNAGEAPWSSMPDMLDVRAQARSFSSIAGISPVWNDVVTINGHAERLQSLYVSASFFPMLGVNPVAGRTFTQDDDKLDAGARVMLLSYPYWQRQFGGSPGAIGQSVNVNGSAFTVIGVLPRDFQYLGEPVAGTPASIDVWFPLATNQIAGSPRWLRFLKVVGKLQPGVTAAQASEEMRTIGANLARAYKEDAALVYSATPLESEVTGKVRPMMLLLLGAVGLVLLMACANVANLLLTAAIARGKEIAVRAALGASRFRLLRQFLSESILLAGLATLAGIGLAFAILRALVAAAPATLLEGRTVELDNRAMLFTIGVAAISALLSGLPPAWRVLRGDIAVGLRETGRGFISGHQRFRAGLVIAQMSLALALLIGAGLLIRSFARLLDVNPGFDAAHTATVTTLLSPSITTAAQAIAQDHALIARIASLPGVRAAGAVSRLPLQGSNLGSWLWIDGRNWSAGQQPSVEYRVASPGYFSAMEIPLLAGREFDDHDAANPAGIALINETAARMFWGHESPIGQHIKLGPNPEKQNWITVIGVIGDVHHFGLDKDASPEAYRPLDYSGLFNPILVARVEGDPAAALEEMAGAVHAVDPAIPVYNELPLSALVERSTAQRRFLMLLLTGFAACALFLAAIGIYGTFSQSVEQRTRELGLRMALGASQASVLRMILKQALALATIGALIGGAMAAALTRLMRTSLFEVTPLDPAVFALAIVTLCMVAVVACLAPAYRATRVDPLEALRHE
jgi:predicted permease